MNFPKLRNEPKIMRKHHINSKNPPLAAVLGSSPDAQLENVNHIRLEINVLIYLYFQLMCLQTNSVL